MPSLDVAVCDVVHYMCRNIVNRDTNVYIQCNTWLVGPNLCMHV